ncbi:aflatoxin regulatory protein-domain-containing protein [Rhexocercosporidium sp. MPI-PUGE-AT-0058]|nr:aflatoxin regulatory protein-domain-containing protein [Rhexocercosporidium sp. MPI-PUGE-AT-0058]
MPSTSLHGLGTAAPVLTGSTTSKIRDSCQACSLSKVKCNKEKPTCSRCAKRAVACEYLVTKRPGRKRDSTNVRPGSSEESSPTPPSSNTGSKSSPNMYEDVFVSLELNRSPAIHSPRDEYGNLHSPFMHDFFELNTTDANAFTQGYNDIEKLLLSENIDFDYAFHTGSLERVPPSKNSSPSGSPNGQPLSISTSYTNVSAGVDTSLKSTCNCLTVAFEFMRKFSSIHPAAFALSQSPDNSLATLTSNSRTPSAQDVVMENKHTIEVVSSILQCSCADDAYLLTTLSMVIFKILARYTTAAQNRPGRVTRHDNMSSDTSSDLSIYYDDDSHRGRLATQTILGELHHVQKLVNQLSLRLKICKMVTGRDDEGDCKMMSTSAEPEMENFSATTLNQIEMDLRKCLGTLSSEIISVLRQS